MWTDCLGNAVTLEHESSLGPLNDFVEGFIASEARAVNILQAVATDTSAIVQACTAAMHTWTPWFKAASSLAPSTCWPSNLHVNPNRPASSARRRRFTRRLGWDRR